MGAGESSGLSIASMRQAAVLDGYFASLGEVAVKDMDPVNRLGSRGGYPPHIVFLSQTYNERVSHWALKHLTVFVGGRPSFPVPVGHAMTHDFRGLKFLSIHFGPEDTQRLLWFMEQISWDIDRRAFVDEVLRRRGKGRTDPILARYLAPRRPSQAVNMQVVDPVGAALALEEVLRGIVGGEDEGLSGRSAHASASSVFGVVSEPSSVAGSSVFGGVSEPASIASSSVFGDVSEPASIASSSVFGEVSEPSSVASASSVFGVVSEPESMASSQAAPISEPESIALHGDAASVSSFLAVSSAVDPSVASSVWEVSSRVSSGYRRSRKGSRGRSRGDRSGTLDSSTAASKRAPAPPLEVDDDVAELASSVSSEV